MPAGGGLKRKRNGPDDRFEEEEAAFHQRVRDGYLKLAALERDRWLVIDGTGSRAAISKIIRNKVETLISRGR